MAFQKGESSSWIASTLLEKIEPLLPLFTKKEGRKDFVIISTHHFQIAFSHPMFAGWAATSCVERKKAKSRGKEICGQVRYNLPVQTSSMFNCFQHPRQICISYMPLPLLLHRRVKKLLLFLLSSHQSTFLAGLQKNSSVDESLKINLWLELWHSYSYTQQKSFTFIHSFYLELLLFCECRPFCWSRFSLLEPSKPKCQFQTWNTIEFCSPKHFHTI